MATNIFNWFRKDSSDVSIRAAENGFIVNYLRKEYVFGTLKQALKAIENSFKEKQDE